MLKFFKRAILLLVVICFSLAAGLHIFLSREGGRLVSEKLEQAFRRPVKVGTVRTAFPFDLIVENIEVEGLFSIRRCLARSGMIDIFSGNFILSEMRLHNAEVNFVRPSATPVRPQESSPGHIAIKLPPGPPAAVPDPKPEHIVIKIPEASAAAEVSGGGGDGFLRSRYFFIKKLVVIDSILHFIDREQEKGEIKITVKNVNVRARNLQFPAVTPVITSFTLTGEVPGEDRREKGKIELSGWINLVDKDMRADLKVTDFDARKFYPYCRDWLDMEKANISAARINFQSEITGLKNDVIMDCRLSVSELRFEESKEGESRSPEQKLTSAVASILGNSDGGMAFGFKIRTKMDSPEFGFGVVRRAFETRVSEARRDVSHPGLMQAPARLVGGTFKTAADLTRSVINGTVGIGSVITSTFREAFERQKQAVDDETRQLEEKSGVR